MIVGCRSQACALQAVASLPSLGSGRAAACSTLLTFQTFNYSPTTPALLQSNVSSRKILFPIARACCSLLCTFRCKQFELITERRPGKLLSVAMDRSRPHVPRDTFRKTSFLLLEDDKSENQEEDALSERSDKCLKHLTN